MNYVLNLWSALLGRKNAPPTELQSPPSFDAELRSRVAGLEFELRERDEQIVQMKREYSAMEAARTRAESAGGNEQLEKLVKKTGGVLASLSMLSTSVRQGKDVSAGDMAGLVADLEKQLSTLGIKPIGETGQETTFDVAAHQRMSGGSVHARTPVVVRLPGYRLGEKVIQKAMVTARE